MFVKILLVFVVIMGGFFAYVAMQPSEMNISREILIKASPEALFLYINHSKKMNDWMPWQASDPGVKIEYSGPEEGVGSKSSWDSTGKMGTGNAVIVESRPNQFVRTQLTYTKPMVMSQLAEVSLNSTSEGTLVRWSVKGQNSFVSRIFCAFINMDKMVGGEFEKGLAKLKTIAETTR